MGEKEIGAEESTVSDNQFERAEEYRGRNERESGHGGERVG